KRRGDGRVAAVDGTTQCGDRTADRGTATRRPTLCRRKRGVIARRKMDCLQHADGSGRRGSRCGPEKRGTRARRRGGSGRHLAHSVVEVRLTLLRARVRREGKPYEERLLSGGRVGRQAAVRASNGNVGPLPGTDS